VTYEDDYRLSQFEKFGANTTQATTRWHMQVILAVRVAGVSNRSPDEATMQNLSYPAGAVELRNAVPYLDTLELFFRCLPKGIRGLIGSTQGKPPIIKPCKNKSDWVWGYRVIVHQPSIPTQKILDVLQEQHGAVICRFDIAYDFPHVTRAWLERHVIMRWRRKGAMLEQPNGVYFIVQKGRRKRSGRDIYLYDDRPSKITGELDVPHLDLRFQNAEAVRRQGINLVRDLIDLNPRELFEKHLKLVNVNIEGVTNLLIRKTLRAERERHQRRRRQSKKICPFLDRFRASLPHRLRCQLNRLFRGRAQLVKDLFPDLISKSKPITIDVLNVPRNLEHHDKYV
jgi:hypothetical protein